MFISYGDNDYTTCLFGSFVFARSHLVWDPYSGLSSTWGSQHSNIFTFLASAYSRLFLVTSPSQQTFKLDSSPYFRLVLKRGQCRRFRAYGFFLVIFNYRRHSLADGQRELLPDSLWSAGCPAHSLSAFTNYYFYKLFFRMCPWCNGYRRRKWIRRHKFKSWTRLIAFHIALIPLGKV